MDAAGKAYCRGEFHRGLLRGCALRKRDSLDVDAPDRIALGMLDSRRRAVGTSARFGRDYRFDGERSIPDTVNPVRPIMLRRRSTLFDSKQAKVTK
jgi:hypothetical protein